MYLLWRTFESEDFIQYWTEAEVMNVEVSGHNLESSQTWGSRTQCLYYKPVSNHFCAREGGRVKSVSKWLWIARMKTLLDFCSNVQEFGLWRVSFLLQNTTTEFLPTDSWKCFVMTTHAFVSLISLGDLPRGHWWGSSRGCRLSPQRSTSSPSALWKS